MILCDAFVQAFCEAVSEFQAVARWMQNKNQHQIISKLKMDTEWAKEEAKEMKAALKASGVNASSSDKEDDKVKLRLLTWRNQSMCCVVVCC